MTGPGDVRRRGPEPLDELAHLLRRSVKALADAGCPAVAARIGASAWSLLRSDHHVEAERFNGLLHYVARLDVSPYNQEVVMSDDQVLDVRSEPPARRHELIFETYGRLGAGEGFVLVNDHDPKPLRYQFEAEHAGEFSWDYQEEGPATWKVRIGRT